MPTRGDELPEWFRQARTRYLLIYPSYLTNQGPLLLNCSRTRPLEQSTGGTPPRNHLRTYSSPVALNQGSLLIECRAEPEPPCWEPTSPSEGVSEPESGWLDTPLAAALLEAALQSARASPEGGLLESLAASSEVSSGRRSSLESCPENRHYLYTCRVSPSSKDEE